MSIFDDDEPWDGLVFVGLVAVGVVVALTIWLLRAFR